MKNRLLRYSHLARWGQAGVTSAQVPSEGKRHSDPITTYLRSKERREEALAERMNGLIS